MTFKPGDMVRLKNKSGVPMRVEKRFEAIVSDECWTCGWYRADGTYVTQPFVAGLLELAPKEEAVGG